MLPEQYTDDWFVRSNIETLNAGMALYDSQNGCFYTVRAVEKFTAYLCDLSTDTEQTEQRQQIESQLYEEWVPVEVRA